MKRYQGYLIDLDGTIYAGRTKIPAAKRFIERLQHHQVPFLFVTNNTTKLPLDVVKNLADNHDIHVNEENVYTAGLATADYIDQLAEQQKRNKTVYVIGEDGLIQAIKNKGFTITGDHPEYVVVALDSDVTYEKFCLATLAIKDGATFIGSNPDTNIPNQRGMLPGAGSLIALVEYATQTKPVYVGKPEPIILQNGLERLGLHKDEVVMVGDNYNTDIKAGINFGIDTILVYTGVSKPSDIQKVSTKPTYEIDSLDEIEL